MFASRYVKSGMELTPRRKFQYITLGKVSFSFIKRLLNRRCWWEHVIASFYDREVIQNIKNSSNSEFPFQSFVDILTIFVSFFCGLKFSKFHKDLLLRINFMGIYFWVF